MSTPTAHASTHASTHAAAPLAGVLALELAPGTAPAVAALPPGAAAALAALVGRDLGALDGGVQALDLVLGAAHFDPAEALRPGWPLHRRLAELHQRAPRQGLAARVIAIGADADGRVPLPLQAEADLQGGALRVLPFLLTGPADVLAPVAARLEQVLVDRGMAGADTALAAQDGFGARIEHARLLTVHDLAAMTALQYTHQGLEPLWQVIETALLSPGRDAGIDAPPEPQLHLVDGEARIALLSPDAWCRRYTDGTACESDDDRTRLERRFALFQARQRQYADVLRAHGIEVVFEQVDDA